LLSCWGALCLCLALIGAACEALAADGSSVAGLSRALAAAETRSGNASPQLLPLLDQLAGAQTDGGALADAAKLRRRALKIALATYGGDSPNAANAMTALAQIELLRHDYFAAEPLLTVATTVLTAKFGADNPALVQPLAALGRLAVDRGDLDLAERFANRATALAARDPTHPTEPLRVLGALDAAREHYDAGAAVLRQAVSTDRHYHGDDSEETARSLAQLANLLLRAKRFDEALPAIEQALAIDQARLGATHPLIADDFCDLGLIYSGLNRDDDAAGMLTYAIGLLDEGAARDTTRTAYAELDLAGVLHEMGYDNAANAIFDDGKHILNDADKADRNREREL
jgi:tetratricopeptide (TPR) repeat protein